MTTIEFMHAHWFLMWLLAWFLWPATWSVYALVVVVIQNVRIVCIRILRALTVMLRGWPPEHLDADGDWRPLPKPPAPPVQQDTP